MPLLRLSVELQALLTPVLDLPSTRSVSLTQRRERKKGEVHRHTERDPTHKKGMREQEKTRRQEKRNRGRGNGKNQLSVHSNCSRNEGTCIAFPHHVQLHNYYQETRCRGIEIRKKRKGK